MTHSLKNSNRISELQFEAQEDELRLIWSEIFVVANQCGKLDLIAWVLNEVWSDVREGYLSRERALSL
jgi:hypothetical protein